MNFCLQEFSRKSEKIRVQEIYSELNTSNRNANSILYDKLIYKEQLDANPPWQGKRNPKETIVLNSSLPFKKQSIVS